MNESFFSEHTSPVPLMAIYRGFDTDRTVELCHRVWDAGIELVEIPVQSPAAIETLRVAARAAADRGAMVGAGTVVSVELVQAALEAGAAFTVAPGLAPEVVAASHNAGLPHLPGVATPSEVHEALRLGLTWLKAFPAEQLGVGWADALHGPFPQARFIATGGVTPANAEQYFAGGASAASLTSALADDEQFALVPDLIARLRRRAA